MKTWRYAADAGCDPSTKLLLDDDVLEMWDDLIVPADPLLRGG